MTIYELLTSYQEAQTTAAEKEAARAAAYAARIAEIDRATAAMEAAVAAGDQEAYQQESVNLAFARAAAEKVEDSSPFYTSDQYDLHHAQINDCVKGHRQRIYSKICKHLTEIDTLLLEDRAISNTAEEALRIVANLANTHAQAWAYTSTPAPSLGKFAAYARERAEG